MKSTIIKFQIRIIFFGLVLFTTSCIEDFGGVGEPSDKIGALSGTWQLDRVIQVDEDAVRKGFPDFVQRMDITNIFNFSDMKLILEIDGETPSNFTIERGGAPEIIDASSGQWEVDNLAMPSTITFAGNSTLEFENYLGLQEGFLNLKLTRYQTNSKGEKQAIVSYRYQFKKQ